MSGRDEAFVGGAEGLLDENTQVLADLDDAAQAPEGERRSGRMLASLPCSCPACWPTGEPCRS